MTRSLNKASGFRAAPVRTLFRWVIIGLGAGVLTTVLIVLVFRWVNPPTSAFMLRYRFSAPPSGKKVPIRQTWVEMGRISPAMRLAAVAAEDQKFPYHFGFDLESISDAVENHIAGRRLRGASTISQQTAKNMFLWPGRSFVRKGLEVYFTGLLELLWPKRRILEVYLNIAEFGEGVYGVGAAADRYYHKSASKLTVEEAARLASVLPSPRRMRPDRPSAYALERAQWIQDQMRMLGPSYLKSL